MNLHLTIGPLVPLIAGILILVVPRLHNYIVAIYLIIIGLLGLFGSGTFICVNSSEDHPRPTELLPLRHSLGSIAYGYATRSAARMSVTAVTYGGSWEPSRFGDSSLAIGVGTLARGGPGRWFVSADRLFCPCSPPHRSRRDSQVCCEAGGETLAARSPLSAHAAAGDQYVTVFLGRSRTHCRLHGPQDRHPARA